MTEIAGVYGFVRVIGEDGAFYDLIHRSLLTKHINKLRAEGYLAEKISRQNVPPCKYRDFAESLTSYTDGIWQDGTDFYFPEEG